MRTIHDDGLSYFLFPRLAAIKGVFHGVFARFAQDHEERRVPLNIGLNGGDAQEKVWENRSRISAALGTGVAVFARQVHGADVGVWEGLKPSGQHEDAKFACLDGDALVTAVRGHSLVIQVADCQSVLMADPVRGVVANVHSGWRGSIRNVIGRTIERMVVQFGCRPQDIICGIGPSLGPCCAEFVHFQREIPPGFWGYRRSGDFFDFWRLSNDQLMNAGVLPGHIDLSGMCTKCNQHLFFSYRGNKTSGRFAAVIGMR